MQLVTVAQMRELDRRTIEERGTPGEVLMDRAGVGVAKIVQSLSNHAGLIHPHIQCVAGKGNNGGDAFVTARYLKETGFSVDVLLAGEKDLIQGDARRHLNRMLKIGVPLCEILSPEDWKTRSGYPENVDIIIDGLLGTGGVGPTRDLTEAAVQYINLLSEEALVVAIDVPSGLNADTGETHGAVVKADITATIGCPKRGFVESNALDYIGSLDVIDIGIPKSYINELVSEDPRECVAGSELKSLLPRRSRSSHKGDYGHVLLLGGARGYTGAIAMAAQAAMRSGGGRVTVLVPESIVDIVASASPEIMVVGCPETEVGSLAVDLWKEWRSRVDEFGAILLGPGMTRHNDTFLIGRQFFRGCEVPMVLDADAISVFGGQPHWMERARAPTILTPHPGELARLFGQEISDIQADRCGVTLAAAKYIHSTVLLKGGGTVIASHDKPAAVNLTGNPGMATAGSGDVLAGIVVGLLGSGIEPYDAARLAVYLHGKAGDLVAWRGSQAGLIASDIINEIPIAYKSLTPR
ncbi:MAG: NAD(P)H-hydrate dehydratase [Kiritimatiellae bacterium]|nr:NAD(P)H-hydrate dehydratase [Kiritimatiellia bacterium]